MKIKQLVFLFVALLLPVAIFIFLKVFGKNEFNVAPMFTTEAPSLPGDCQREAAVPYTVDLLAMKKASIEVDSLSCVWFSASGDSERLQRVREEFGSTPLRIYRLESAGNERLKECFFALKEPFDVVLVDKRGRIRGQYNSASRDEIDRLITEVAIILKLY